MQPATLILSRDEGRTLRQLNGDSERFDWWYRTCHVNQFTDYLALWTTLLYVCAAGVVALVFGNQLLRWRRPPAPFMPRATHSPAPRRWTRDLHRKLGAVVGGVLAFQLLVGTYL